MSNHTAGFYWKLFTSTFALSAFTFGGGYVIVPLMKKRFVDQLHWLEEAEMLDFVAIAQSTPGPMAVNAAVLAGYRLAGLAGALVSIAGTIMPPLVLLSLISLGYSAFIRNEIVRHVLRGMEAGVCAVILDVVLSMAWGVFRQKQWLAVLLMVGAFVTVAVFQVNVIYVILCCALVGVLRVTGSRRKERSRHDVP